MVPLMTSAIPLDNNHSTNAIKSNIAKQPAANPHQNIRRVLYEGDEYQEHNHRRMAGYLLD